MKHLLKCMHFLETIAVIMLFGCANPSANDSASQPAHDTVDCSNSFSFGDIKFCLPKVDGMQECYSNPFVKSTFDKIEYKDNSVLGIYLNDSTYSTVSKLAESNFDDYAKVYAMTNTSDMDIGQSDWNQISDMMTKNYLKVSWDELKTKIHESDSGLSIDQPVLIDEHSPNKHIKTLVLLVKYKYRNKEDFTIVSLSLIHVKNRVIFLSYYKEYDGDNSMQKAKAKGDYLALKFMEEQ